MLCILYVVAMGTGLGAAGLLIDRAMPTAWPRRWLWCAVIVASIFVPAQYRVHHMSVVGERSEHHSRLGAFGDAVVSAPLSVRDAQWWARTESHGPIIVRAWLIASGTLLLWGLVHAWRVTLIVRAARRRSATTAVDGIEVVVTDSVGPATVGFLPPRVLVPHWVLTLSGAQRRYVLRHEEEHRRALDPHLLLLASLALVIMPWNPALWWQLRRLHLATELDCDQRVVARLGDAHDYGELLLKVAQAANRGPRLQPALLGGSGMLERRLRSLMSSQRWNAERFLLPVAATVLLLIVLSLPHPVVGADPHAHGDAAPAATVAAGEVNSDSAPDQRFDD